MTQHDLNQLNSPITGEADKPSGWHEFGTALVLLFFGMAAMFGGE